MLSAISNLRLLRTRLCTKHILKTTLPPQQSCLRPVTYCYSTDVNYSSEENEPQLDNSEKPVSYYVCDKDFEWVKNVLPPSRIPYPPKHESYPTPSGWCAPSDEASELPYFVHRTSYFVLPVSEKEIDEVGWVTKVDNIEGDIYALEAHLYDVVSPLCEYDPAISVNEAEMSILIRGTYLAQIEDFLHKNHF